MQTIYLIRHGETDHNRDGRVQGHTESQLSELGREQARRLGTRLEKAGIKVAVSSPLARAVDTARIALDGTLPFVTRDGLREIHLGEWEGKIAAEIRKAYPNEVKLWFEQPSRLRIPGGESMRQFRRRVRGTMDSVRDEFGDTTIAVFVHGGVICCYLTSLLGMKLDDIWRFKIRNGSITRVTFPMNKPRIDLLGEVHYLGDALSKFASNAPRMFP
ncbi:MAG: histidine phosphatase family protein [Candidatus Krumholzibacteria bacterium]|jgi:broad specificity phosphatase PhoE|nr:histidine phosphatase family protein [Candidatus Krumholzibacteria bacterium]